jgi:hypothetical protein
MEICLHSPPHALMTCIVITLPLPLPITYLHVCEYHNQALTNNKLFIILLSYSIRNWNGNAVNHLSEPYRKYSSACSSKLRVQFTTHASGGGGRLVNSGVLRHKVSSRVYPTGFAAPTCHRRSNKVRAAMSYYFYARGAGETTSDLLRC